MTHPPLLSRVRQAFQERFSQPPAAVARAPGRVNLIGDHTDYNDGFVLPMAIDHAVWIALQPLDERRVLLHSLDFEQQVELELDKLQKGPPGWAEYVKGVAWAMQEAGYRLCGWRGVMAGDVPAGAGLSSSAALELAVARAFAASAGLPWEPATMAKLCQKAENHWVGVNCGIMDQMISAAGQAGHALLIDCRTLAAQTVPLPPGAAVVVLDTATRRGLVDSAYNERRAQCEEAARYFGAAALREVDLARLASRPAGLDELTYRRARHVVSENERTLQAARAMQNGDAPELGRLMDASHTSLRDDFEVSSPALDAMVDCARRQAGCWGARMTGAGFGGCAVALVEAEKAQSFAAETVRAYQAVSGRQPAIYICQASDGAEVIENE